MVVKIFGSLLFVLLLGSVPVAQARPVGHTEPHVTLVPGVVHQVSVDPVPARANLAVKRTRTGQNLAPREVTMVSSSHGWWTLSHRQSAGLHSGDLVQLTLTTPPADHSDRQAAESGQLGTVTSVRRIGDAAPAQSTRTTNHQLIVMPVFTTVPDAASLTELKQMAVTAAEYWTEQSGGRLHFTTEVLPWRRIAANATCDPATSYARALQANGRTAPIEPNDHVVLYQPYQSKCAWGGLGTVAGSNIWVNGFTTPDVLTHELGHNLGLGHANTATCTDVAGAADSYSDTCTVNEYADGSDIMGYATYEASGSLNSALADALGFRRVTTVESADLTAGPGRFMLPALDTQASGAAGGSGLHPVRLRLDSGWLYLDYRPATGRDTRRPEWAGIQARYRPLSEVPTTQLLDLQPWFPQPWQAPAAALGWVWRIGDTGLTLHVDSQQPGYATITLAAAQPDSSAPAPAPSISTTDAERTLTWNVDTTGATCGYRVLADGAITTVVPATKHHSVLPVTAQLAAVDAVSCGGRLTPGPRLVVSTGLPAQDTTAPTAPSALIRTPLPGPQRPGIMRAERLEWAPATDADSGIWSYRVLVAGELWGRELPPWQTNTVIHFPVNGGDVQVSACNGVGNCSKATGIPKAELQPARPTITHLQAGSDGHSVTIRWSVAAATHATATPDRFVLNVDGRDVRRVANTASSITLSDRALARPGSHDIQVVAMSYSGLRSLSPPAKVDIP